jgi:hypothetical protein
VERRAGRRRTVLIIQIVVEDGLAEIVNAPGSTAAIENAVHKTILSLKQDFYERASRVPSASSFRGTGK